MTEINPEPELAKAQERCTSLNGMLDVAKTTSDIDQVERLLKEYDAEHAWKRWKIPSLYSQVTLRARELRNTLP
jgi:hypothetical protein